MGRARKSVRREKVVDAILGGLKSQKIYKTLDYGRKASPTLRSTFTGLFSIGCAGCARTCTRTSGGTKRGTGREPRSACTGRATSIRDQQPALLKLPARPNFKVNFEDLEVAVEIKRGESGAAVREGLGQAVVYAQRFDFVVYLFIDTSKDKKVLASMEGTQERSLIETLSDTFNIRFDVV